VFEFVWFLGGAVCAGLLVWFVRRPQAIPAEIGAASENPGTRRHGEPTGGETAPRWPTDDDRGPIATRPHQPPPAADEHPPVEIEPEASDPEPPPAAPRPRYPAEFDEIQPFVTVVGRELASLTSAVHGSAELLLEALGDSRMLPVRAADLWAAVFRIQRFGRKLLAFSGERHCPSREVFSVPDILEDMQRELRDDTMGSLEVDLHVASTLPGIRGNASEFRDALHFLADSLISLEPATQQILIRALHLLGRETSSVHIEMTVLSQGPGDDALSWIQLRLGFQAARLAVERMGGTLALEYDPGDKAALFITLPATTPCATEVDAHDGNEAFDVAQGATDETTVVLDPVAAAPDRGPAHGWGGVLVLESDPILRQVLSNALRGLHRSFSTCADGASAQALFNRTPERFELLVLEQNARLVPGETVAVDALARHPEVKVLLLTKEKVPFEDPRLFVLPKPFGHAEVLDALGAALAAPAAGRGGDDDPGSPGAGSKDRGAESVDR